MHELLGIYKIESCKVTIGLVSLFSSHSTVAIK